MDIYRSADQLRERNRATNEKLAAALAERGRREARQLQSNPNGGLLEFIRYFWHVLEPVDPFVEGWSLECLCAHLEAISRGDTINIAGVERRFNRGLFNVPPGFMKSLCTNVFLPAWEWGPRGMPHLRYVAFSYASELTERDNAKFRDLVCSDAYRELWGHVFNVVGDGKIRVTNDKTGFKFASSFGGVGTGERGHRVLCFAGDQKVFTENGPIPIQEIVEQRKTDRVWSFNKATGQLELKPITAWHKNPGRALVKITTESGATLTCTQDHKVYTAAGKVPAALLIVGNDLLAAPRGMRIPPPVVISAQTQVEMAPSSPRADAAYCRVANSELTGQRAPRFIGSGSDLAHHGFCQMRGTITKRAMLLTVGNVLCASAVFKITNAAVHRIAVQVANFLSSGTRAYKCFHQQLMHQPIVGSAILAQTDPRVAIVSWGSAQQFSRNTKCSAPYALDNTIQASNSPRVGNLIEPFESNDRTPVFDRVVSVEFLQDMPSATYCITVADNHNLLCGETATIVCANCDDVHKLRGTQETDEARNAVTTWVREAMQNRLNDLTRDVIIVIMQRVHEADASGSIMEHLGDEYCSLIVPMEYEQGRHFSHYTGWNNGEDPRTYDGQLAWPERYPAHVLASYKRNAYLWAGQYQQNPTPRGGGIFKEDWWQPYEVPPSKVYDFTPIFTIASLDTAFKEDQENDYCALTVLSLYDHPKTGQRRIILVDAWQKRLPMHGVSTPRESGEDERAYLRRAAGKWGLCEWVNFTCSKRRVDRLVIEDSARGHDVNAELRRVFADRDFGVVLMPARGSKWTRAHGVVDLFVDNMIYAPGEWICTKHGPTATKCDCAAEQFTWHWREWAAEVINQTCSFPRAAHDDLVDALVQALRHLRETGLAIRREERELSDMLAATFKRGSGPTSRPLYDV